VPLDDGLNSSATKTNMTTLLKVRRVVRRVFRNAGYQRRIAPDFFEIMADNSVDVVLDVGANDGDFGRDIRDRG